jgi:hypothetical protein
MAIGITGANNGYSRSTADVRFTKLSAGIVNGGNTTGAAVTIGTRDAQSLNLETTDAIRLTILAAGNVGIGTVTPSERLTVSGNISANGTLAVAATSISNGVNIVGNDGTSGVGMRISNTAASGSEWWLFSSGSNPSAGIGGFGLYNNTTSKYALRSTSAGVVTFEQVTTLTGGMRIPTQSSYFGVGTYGTVSETNGGLAYITGNNIKASTTVNNQVEKVTSGANAAQFIRMRYDQGISLHTGVGAGDGAGTNYADNINSRLIVDLTGNVGINNISPGEKLDVGGNIKVNGITIGKGTNFGTTITNTGVGVNSLIAVTTGTNNTAVGYESLKALTTGSYNTAYGMYTLFSNTSGTQNIAIGGAALITNSTGSYNIAIGHTSLYSNISGNLNTAAGWKALFANTTGSYNVATGNESLQANTTGSYNVGGGYFALGLNTTGIYNVGFGVAALGGITGSSNRNIAIGTEAGRYTTGSTVLTGASNCIFIGDVVKSGANDTSNCTVIGNGITGSGSNTTTINSTAVTSTKIDGTTAHVLHVTGSIKTINTLFGNLPAAATAGNGARSYITNSTLVYNGTNIGSAAAGGGANHSPVIVVNGVWVIG